MSDYADTMTFDQFARLECAVDAMRVDNARMAQELAAMRREIERIPRRLESLEQSIDVPQTVDARGAARLIGVSVDTVRRDAQLRSMALSAPKPLRWRRSDVLAEIDRRSSYER
jgi:hypothetical protein